MELRYYNTKLDRYDKVEIPPYSKIEEAIMYHAIKLYGDDFYLLVQHNNELEYTLNSDISCIVCI